MGSLSDKYRYHLSESMYYDPVNGLVRDGVSIKLTPQAEALLQALIEADGEIVSKKQLAERLDIEYYVDNTLIQAKKRLQASVGKGIVSSRKGEGYFLTKKPTIEKKYQDNAADSFELSSNFQYDKNLKVFGRRGQVKKIGEIFESYGSYDSNKESSRIVVISGISGIGKSTLAREYARQLQETDSEYVVIEKIAASAQEALLKLVPVDPSLRSTVTAIDLLSIFKRATKGKKVLLIINDFNTDSDLDDTVHWEDFGCDIILTTWYDNWLDVYDGGGLKLSSTDLRPPATRDIFLEYYARSSELREAVKKHKEELEAIDEITNRLQNVPLLIKLTAMQMTTSDPVIFPSQEIKVMDSWGLNFGDSSPFASSYFGFNYKKDTENIGQKSYFDIIDYIWESGQKKHPLEPEQIRILSLMTLTSNYGISGRRFGEWAGLGQAGASALKALSKCGWIDYIPSKHDPLDRIVFENSKTVSSGVYIMAEPIRNALARKGISRIDGNELSAIFSYFDSTSYTHILKDLNEEAYLSFFESWYRSIVICGPLISEEYINSIMAFTIIDCNHPARYDTEKLYQCKSKITFINEKNFENVILATLKLFEATDLTDVHTLIKIYDAIAHFYSDCFDCNDYDKEYLCSQIFFYKGQSLIKKTILKEFNSEILNAMSFDFWSASLFCQNIDELLLLFSSVLQYLNEKITVLQYIEADPFFHEIPSPQDCHRLAVFIHSLKDGIVSFLKEESDDFNDLTLLKYCDAIKSVNDLLFRDFSVYEKVDPLTVLICFCRQSELCVFPTCYEEVKRILNESINYCNLVFDNTTSKQFVKNLAGLNKIISMLTLKTFEKKPEYVFCKYSKLLGIEKLF